VFRALCVVARNTFQHQIFAFDTKFSRLGVGTKTLSEAYTKYLMFASRVETINTKSGYTKHHIRVHQTPNRVAITEKKSCSVFASARVEMLLEHVYRTAPIYAGHFIFGVCRTMPNLTKFGAR
jgi:hypothetical protein